MTCKSTKCHLRISNPWYIQRVIIPSFNYRNRKIIFVWCLKIVYYILHYLHNKYFINNIFMEPQKKKLASPHCLCLTAFAQFHILFVDKSQWVWQYAKDKSTKAESRKKLSAKQFCYLDLCSPPFSIAYLFFLIYHFSI